MTPETIAHSLGRPSRKAGGGWMCLCPCHDDHDPSLSVDEKNGKILVKCMSAGCSQDAIVSALKERGLWPEAERIPEMPKIKQVVTGRYDYHGPDGALLYYKERLEPGKGGRSKEFRFRNAGEKGYGRNGHPPTLYNLPDVLKCKSIIITEGEKHADLLKSWKLTATTLDSGSSSSLTDEHINQLTGKRVAILRDNDEPGRTFALTLANALHGKTESLKVVLLPGLLEKGDIIDWAAEPGNDRAKLLEIIKATPEWIPEPIPSPAPVTENAPQAEYESDMTADWPEPILFGEIATPDIPASILPGWLGEYAAAVAATTQTPPGMSVMMALAVVAACIQKRFQVARTPEHIEPLALWTATALPPASRKTAVVNAFTGPLTAWERERDESEKQERAKIAAIRDVTENRIKALQAQAVKADNATDRNSLIDEACRLKETMPGPLTPPRIFTGDVTPERLQGMLVEQGERMALLSDEGGIFAVMAGLYSGGKTNINVFLQGHAGSAVRVDRQDRTAHLDEPALTFGLCIQPDIIRRLSETSFRGNGCLARFLFCLPVSNIGTRTAGTIPMPGSVKAAFQAGINKLLNIPAVQNECGQERARTITLDHGAAQVWEAFYTFMESNMGEGRELEPIQDWAGKLTGASLRIAGIMAIVEHGEAVKEINEATMTRALDLAELLISHAQAAFDLMDGDDAQHDAKHVFRWILDKGTMSFKLADLYRELRRFNDADRLTRALKALTARHIISEPIKSGTGGRPSISFEVNPYIFGKGQA